MSTPSSGVVLAGGGLASQRCAEKLRAEGYDGRLVMLAAEEEPPYDRPPLSKEVLVAARAPSSLAFRAASWYADHGVEVRLGAAAAGLEPRGRIVRLQSGESIAYEKLLIATGSRPRRLPLFEGFANVHELRTLPDSLRLRGALRAGGPLVIVGAGFIGQEVAAAARTLGVPTTILEAAPVPLGRLLGEQVGTWLVDRHREAGVEVLTSTCISRARGDGSVEVIELEDGTSIECGTVLVGVGVAPAAEWVDGSGLSPDGVLTDAAGRTPLEGVFAAGDVARPFDPRFGVHARCEHWDAAARQGVAAALAMLGREPRPATAPSFWSDQYGMRIQYVGHAEHADSCEVDSGSSERDLAVTYRRGGVTVAALAVDRPRDILARRREIELHADRHTSPLEGALT